MAENDTRDNPVASTAASVGAPNARWWHLPFDASTNFSLLGFFIEDYLGEPDLGKKIDMDLK
ncbi:MAG: hypothetical protein HY884_08530 [Deltaproteobacteria bacterium]|nr:hypothetical protein [Deltaproteobacteria bacterium]